MSQVEALYQLQLLELNILKNQKRLKAIADQLQNNETVQQARQQLDEAQKSLNPLQTQSRDLDLQIQSNIAKAESAEQRLYSGSVKIPKELQDLQSEIESLKKRRSELEDHQLEVMMTVESAEVALDEAKNQLQTVTQHWEHEHQDLLSEQKMLETEVQSLKQQRRQALERIQADVLAVYNALRPTKGNQPVSMMKNGSCTACGIEQTTMIAKEARQSDKLVKCVNCGRILYAVN